MRSNHKLKSLSLTRETLRTLSADQLGDVAGGAAPSKGGSDCASVMLCPTMFCRTKIFC